MREIRLELKNGTPVGSLEVEPSGTLRVSSSNPLLRPRLEREVLRLIALGPLLENFGYSEGCADDITLHVTRGRFCTPGEPAYLEALATRIRRSRIAIGDSRLLAWVVEATA